MTGVIVMRQYLLTLYRDYAVPIPLERSRQVRASVNELGDKLTDADAFVFKTGLQAEPATAARMTKEQTS
jgi:hypothetical protein